MRYANIQRSEFYKQKCCGTLHVRFVNNIKHFQRFVSVKNFIEEKGLASIGIPILLDHGTYGRNIFIVLPHFQMDLWSIILNHEKKIPFHTVFRLAVQMISAYEYIHSCKHVHADLKASHIMIGPTFKQAYLCDFSSTVPYVEKYEQNEKMLNYGSIEYCSRDAHLVSIFNKIYVCTTNLSLFDFD